jgi:TonB family protein
VLYTAQVRPDGTVESVNTRRVPAKDLGFEEAVRDCVSKWRFEPGAEETGLRQYDGAIRFHVGGTANDEVSIRALLQAFASGWNAESTDAEAVFQVLGGAAPDRQIAGSGSAPSLAEQFGQQKASVGWNIELEPDFEQIRFLRPNVAVVRLPFHHATRAGATPQADGQLALLEATAIKRGEQWTLLGWYPIAGPPSDRRWLAPGIEEPRKLKQVNPSYPDLAREARVSASVVLEMQIDPQGKVSSVKILRGHPIFDEAAMGAAQQWEYEPTGLLGFAPVVMKRVEMEFSLDEASGRVKNIGGAWVRIPGGRIRLQEEVVGFRLQAPSSSPPQAALPQKR